VINILSATIAVALSVTALTTAERTVQTESSAIKRFDQSLNKYLALKERLHREVPELRVTDRSEEIANRSDMLAGAIQRARGTARQGDLFEPSPFPNDVRNGYHASAFARGVTDTAEGSGVPVRGTDIDPARSRRGADYRLSSSRAPEMTPTRAEPAPRGVPLA
jgi:hypothetical protein